MVKKGLITSGITIVFALALFMGYSIVEKTATKKAIQIKVQSVPVNLNLFKMDSARFFFQHRSW